jgi:hypothetical protein
MVATAFQMIDVVGAAQDFKRGFCLHFMSEMHLVSGHLVEVRASVYSASIAADDDIMATKLPAM